MVFSMHIQKTLPYFLLFLFMITNIASTTSLPSLIVLEPKVSFIDNKTLSFNLTLIYSSDIPTNVSIAIILYTYDMKMIQTYRTRFNISSKMMYFFSSSIPLNESLPPDIYHINFTLTSKIENKSLLLTVYLPPTLNDYKLLLQKITSLRMSIDTNNKSMFLIYSTNLQPAVTKTLKAYRASLRAFLNKDIENATLLFHKTKIMYQNLQEQYLKNISKTPFNYAYLKNLDEYLFLDPKVIFTFWSRILITTIFIPILIFVFLPLYATKIDIWLDNLADTFEKIGSNVKLYRSIISDRISYLLTVSKSSIIPSYRFNLLLISAAFISTIGLLTNNIITIIGSMLVSPILSIAVGTSIGLALRDEKIDDITGSYIFWKGIKSEIYTVLLTIATSFLATTLISMVYPIVPTQQILIGSRPNLSDLGIAIGAGFAGSLAFLGSKKETSVIIGAAMALAYIPPASVIGISLVMQRIDITLGSLSLLIVNIIALTFSVYLTARLYVLEPLLADFLKIIFLNFKESIINFEPRQFLNTLASFLVSWINIILNISPLHRQEMEHSLRPYIKYISTSLLKYIFMPISFVFITVFILTTDVLYPVTYMFRTFDMFLSGIVNKEIFLEKYGSLFLYILIFLFVLWLIYSYRITMKNTNLKHSLIYILYSIFIWSLIEYLFELYLFNRAHTLLFLIFFLYITIILYWHRIHNKARAIAVGFALFSLLFIIFQSAYVYQSIVYSQTLANVSDTAKYVVATHLNMRPSDIVVKSSVISGKPILTIGIKTSMGRIDEFKLSKEDINIISQSIRELTSWEDLAIEYYYILTP